MAPPLSGAGRRVLVVGPSWVGDMVMAQSLFVELRRLDPDVAIDVVAPPWSAPVGDRMPEVRRIVPLAVPHGALMLGERRRVGLACRAAGYERALVLPRTWKSALVPWFARVPRRTGERGELRVGLINDPRPSRRGRDMPMVDRYLSLGLEPGAALPEPRPRPRLAPDLDNAARFLREAGVEDTGPVLALMPGAEYGPAKQWPLEHWSGLIREVERDGVRCWLIGGPNDRAAAEAIVAGAGGLGVNLCGRTSLGDAIDLLATVDAAVTNDSGLMHVAAAVGTPLVAIFGSSSPRYTPPLTDRAEVLWRDLDCSPCFARTCPLGHLDCLTGIGVGQVTDAVRRRLAAA